MKRFIGGVLVFCLLLTGLCGCEEALPTESVTTTTTTGDDGETVTTTAGSEQSDTDGVSTTVTEREQTTTGGTTVGKTTGSSTTIPSNVVIYTTTTTSSQPTTTTTIKVSEVEQDSVPTAAPTQPPKEEEPVIMGLTPLSKEEYYGYSLLKKERNSQALLSAYNRIVTGVENMETEFSLRDDQNPITDDDLLKVWYYYQLDYPQHFWLDGGFSYSVSGGRVVSVMISYLMTKNERDIAQAKFDAAVKEILTGVSGSWSEYRRELVVHDALCDRVTYQETGTKSHSSYGALVERTAVCEGYAEAFQYLMYQCGIQCLGVLGTAGGAHKWNSIRIDGIYYYIDVTWDDPVVSDGSDPIITHNYFNISTDLLARDHIIESKYNYPLPTCDSIKANYFMMNGGWLETLDETQVAKVLRNNDGIGEFYLVNHSAWDFVDWFFEHSTVILEKAGFPGRGFGLSFNEVGATVTIR